MIQEKFSEHHTFGAFWRIWSVWSLQILGMIHFQCNGAAGVFSLLGQCFQCVHALNNLPVQHFFSHTRYLELISFLSPPWILSLDVNTSISWVSFSHFHKFNTHVASNIGICKITLVTFKPENRPISLLFLLVCVIVWYGRNVTHHTRRGSSRHGDHTLASLRSVDKWIIRPWGIGTPGTYTCTKKYLFEIWKLEWKCKTRNSSGILSIPSKACHPNADQPIPSLDASDDNYLALSALVGSLLHPRHTTLEQFSRQGSKVSLCT